jgi:hypothetical protein
MARYLPLVLCCSLPLVLGGCHLLTPKQPAVRPGAGDIPTAAAPPSSIPSAVADASVTTPPVGRESPALTGPADVGLNPLASGRVPGTAAVPEDPLTAARSEAAEINAREQSDRKALTDLTAARARDWSAYREQLKALNARRQTGETDLMDSWQATQADLSGLDASLTQLTSISKNLSNDEADWIDFAKRTGDMATQPIAEGEAVELSKISDDAMQTATALHGLAESAVADLSNQINLLAAEQTILPGLLRPMAPGETMVAAATPIPTPTPPPPQPAAQPEPAPLPATVPVTPVPTPVAAEPPPPVQTASAAPVPPPRDIQLPPSLTPAAPQPETPPKPEPAQSPSIPVPESKPSAPSPAAESPVQVAAITPPPAAPAATPKMVVKAAQSPAEYEPSLFRLTQNVASDSRKIRVTIVAVQPVGGPPTGHALAVAAIRHQAQVVARAMITDGFNAERLTITTTDDKSVGPTGEVRIFLNEQPPA